MSKQLQQPKFPLVQTVATPGALDGLSAAGQTSLELLKRHIVGDWGDLGEEEYQRAIDLKPVVGDGPEAAAGRALSYGEWMGLLSVCVVDLTSAGARDASLIALLKVTGLRRAEVAWLELSSYDATTQTLTVHEKRNKIAHHPAGRSWFARRTC